MASILYTVGVILEFDRYWVLFCLFFSVGHIVYVLLRTGLVIVWMVLHLLAIFFSPILVPIGSFLFALDAYCEAHAGFGKTLLGAIRAWWDREQVSKTPELMVKMVKSKWDSGDLRSAATLIREGLEAFPVCAELWMMKGRMLDHICQTSTARDAYEEGVRRCPKSISLWILWAAIEERLGHFEEARSVLTAARLSNPRDDKIFLWLRDCLDDAGLQEIARTFRDKAIEQMTSGRLILRQGEISQLEVYRRFKKN